MSTETLHSRESSGAEPSIWMSLALWLWTWIARPAGVGYLVALLVLVASENRLLFPAPAYPKGSWSHGPEIEDVEFTSGDGTRLHGWYYHFENPRAVVLLCHGNAENVTNSPRLLAALARQHRVACLAFDYRGYGKSAGTPDAEGIVADARAARAWLAQRTGQPEANIVLWGRSLGGGVATDLAADGARGLILQSTFTSMPDVAAHHVWWAPVHWLMRTRLDSLTKITRYRGPLLMTHSRDDRVVPYDQGRALYEAAPGDKCFVECHGRGHNDDPPPEFDVELAKFFDRLH